MVHAPRGWPAIHHDSRNSDTTPLEAPDQFEPAWTALGGSTIGAIPTTDSTGQLYATTPAVVGAAERCSLVALDPDTGTIRWCTNEVNPLAVASSVTVDLDDNLYVGDSEAMHSFDRAGELRWETPIEGFPLSSQFTPDGNLIFITHVGHVYVLDRIGGELLVDEALLPGVTPEPGDISGCLGGSSDSRCYSANTLALDPDTGAFYFTLARPEQPSASVVAMRYRAEGEPRVESLWENQALEGGSAASPTVSADGSRVYTNDHADNLVALDTETGEVVWAEPMGFSSKGSPSVTSDGLIVPTGALGGFVVAYRDAGPHADLVWERRDLPHVGVPAQTSNHLVYAAVIDPDRPGNAMLAVLDASSGETLSTTPLRGSGPITIGTTVGPDGSVYVTGLSTGVFASRPTP